jgi:hypothetical protein
VNLERPTPGRERPDQYPGPEGFLAQLEAGLKIDYLQEKLDKAQRQSAEQEAKCKQDVVEVQALLNSRQSDLSQVAGIAKRLRRYRVKLLR